MRNVTGILENQQPPRPCGQQTSAISEATMDQIFKTLQASKMHKFSSAFPTAEAVIVAKRTWRRGLELEGVTLDMVRTGLHAASVSSGWCPDLGEFIELCKSGSMAGFPTEESAWSEANAHVHDYQRHEWSHAVVYKAMVETGIFTLKTMRGDEVDGVRKRFSHNYAEARRLYATEGFSAPIPKALEKTSDPVVDMARGESAIAAMRANLGMGQ